DLPPRAAEVVRLARSGVSEAMLLNSVSNAPASFELAAEDVLVLKNTGLSSRVLAAMLQHDAKLRQAPGAFVAQPKSDAAADLSYVAYTAPANPAPAPSVSPVKTNTAPAASVPAPRRVKRQPLVVVDQAPPAPLGEVVPLPPEPEQDYAWIPGHWAYHGGAWVWIKGEWKPRPGPGFVWVGGHWARHGRGWTWVPGYWR
ncbi:MAG TPA: YXWGXW repeat-containing protein, partial [Candidatus Sulfotelmatobacter sp.]|nr:YXWGXW repeat-containing protein [Candidatus Sulfotelmatobacter sp.]